MASFIEDVLDFLSTMGAQRKDEEAKTPADMSDYDDDLGFAIGPDAEYTPLGDMINLPKQKAPAASVGGAHLEIILDTVSNLCLVL